jgi:hypothetical protein
VCGLGDLTPTKQSKTSGVSYCALAIYIKKYLKGKRKNNGNSNISPYKNIIFKKVL